MLIFSQSKFGKLPNSKRLERIKLSPNYNGKEFVNQTTTSVMTIDSDKFVAYSKFFFERTDSLTPIDSVPIIKTDLKTLNPLDDLMTF